MSNFELSDQYCNSRILIIDDSQSIIRVASAFLLQSGFRRVESIEDPREALITIEQTQPDLVLLDVMMPEIDGFTILRSMHDRIVKGITQVVMLSAMEDQETIQMAKLLGANDFVPKPFSQEELVFWCVLGFIFCDRRTLSRTFPPCKLGIELEAKVVRVNRSFLPPAPIATYVCLHVTWEV